MAATPQTAVRPDLPSPTSDPVRLEAWFEFIGDFIEGMAPPSSTLMDTGWQQLATGVPAISATLVGWEAEVTISVPDTYTLPGGIGAIEVTPGWRIPAWLRPSASRSAPAMGSAVMNTAASGMVPTVLQIDSSGVFRYVTTNGDKKGLTGTVKYRVGP